MPSPRILLIDDDALFRRSMGRLLERAGYRVWVAATGTEGLAAARARRPDVVLLDRTLPDLDGLRVLQTLHAERPELPVLMVTGDPRPETRAQALRYGAVTLLAKPCEVEGLLAAVAHAALSPTSAAPGSPEGTSGHESTP